MCEYQESKHHSFSPTNLPFQRDTDTQKETELFKQITEFVSVPVCIMSLLCYSYRFGLFGFSFKVYNAIIPLEDNTRKFKELKEKSHIIIDLL